MLHLRDGNTSLSGMPDGRVGATLRSSGYGKGELHEAPCFLVQGTSFVTSVGKGDEALPDLGMRFADSIGGTGWFWHLCHL